MFITVKEKVKDSAETNSSEKINLPPLCALHEKFRDPAAVLYTRKVIQKLCYNRNFLHFRCKIRHFQSDKRGANTYSYDENVKHQHRIISAKFDLVGL